MKTQSKSSRIRDPGPARRGVRGAQGAHAGGRLPPGDGPGEVPGLLDRRRPGRQALPGLLHLLRHRAPGPQPSPAAGAGVPAPAGRHRGQQAGQQRHLHHRLRRVGGAPSAPTRRPGLPAPPVLDRRRRPGGGERPEGRLRLEGAQEPAGGQGREGLQGDPFPRGLPRPQRLHPEPHQHGGSAQAYVLPQVRLAADRQPQGHLPPGGRDPGPGPRRPSRRPWTRSWRPCARTPTTSPA